ncbi:MAG: hypothetical protein ACRDH8_15270 [Actinomycetota bacterium]
MRLTRHAKNRLRWIERRHPGVTETGLIEALPASETIGYDDRGNRRARLVLGGTGLTVVIDEAQGIVITVWVE